MDKRVISSINQQKRNIDLHQETEKKTTVRGWYLSFYQLF